MHDTLIETVKQWNITSSLPLQVGDFKLTAEQRMIREKEKDKEYLIFLYTNADNGWTVRGTINPETNELFVRTDIGMLEFALIEFITEDFNSFRNMVESRLPELIRTYYVDREENFSVLLKNKGITTVDWDSFLPESYAGFRRLIRPNDAVRIINGSYMILAYYDAATRSGLSLMYNILRMIFSPNGVSIISIWYMIFDSSDLKVLKRALQVRLLPVLDVIAADLKAAE